MKWISVELGNVWKKDDQEHNYKLMLEIMQDWKNLEKELSRNYSLYKKSLYHFYCGHLIHEGNRSCGLLLWYTSTYEKYGKFEKGLEGWLPCLNMLEYIRQGEILLELLSYDGDGG